MREDIRRDAAALRLRRGTRDLILTPILRLRDNEGCNFYRMGLPMTCELNFAAIWPRMNRYQCGASI
jgi:hypothetical protein